MQTISSRRVLFGMLIVMCFFLCYSRSYAKTINAASCSSTDVQAAINSAADGDTAAIPAGACTWTATVTLPCHSFTLAGAGAGSTNIAINNTSAAGINIGCSGKSIRITGFTFIGQALSANGVIQIAGGSGVSFRIDHNTFQSSLRTRALWIESPCIVPGCVVDHNTFTDLGYIVKNVMPGDSGLGNGSWTQPMPFVDTTNTVYFEDNTLNYTTDTDLDCAEGGRVVFRHNTVTGTGYGNHGYDSVDNGCVEIDAYDNVLNGNGTAFIGVQFRGGSGFIYNNLIEGQYSGPRIGVTNYRSMSGGFFGSKGFCDGSVSTDGNTPPSTTYHGWPCKEQLGRGTNGASYPVYAWNNCTTSLGCAPGGADNARVTVYAPYPGTDYTAVHMQTNRDWYDSTTSCSGTQSTGVCSGILSARATACTTGVAYFAADDGVQGTLYKCTAQNTWSRYYVPYTYPHPLQGGVVPPPVAPPTGLRAVAN